MLENVKLFYTSGNRYETIFAALTAGIALFFVVFGAAGIAGLQYASATALFALLMLLAGIILSAFALTRGTSSTTRTSKAMLLICLSTSLVILRVIL